MDGQAYVFIKHLCSRDYKYGDCAKFRIQTVASYTDNTSWASLIVKLYV
jgi:hypothetical protein